MSKKGIPGDRFAHHVYKERTVECRRCQNTFTAMMANTPRKYCDECGPIMKRQRKSRASAKSNAKRKGRPFPPEPKPRLVRYAGFDPSERH
jgi:PHP family Zn ribbon phosphoesterase